MTAPYSCAGGFHGLPEAEVYEVVVNHEGQYSVWPERRENPDGWIDGRKAASKDICLEYIQSVWTDMRHQSLRKAMTEINAVKSEEMVIGR